MITYKVILECKQDGENPRISPFNISKEQYNLIQVIVHQNQKKNGGNYR